MGDLLTSQAIHTELDKTPRFENLLLNYPWIKGAAATLALSILCTSPILMSALPHIGAPWGAGDMTYFYFMGWTWEFTSHAQTNTVNYPFGIDPNAFAGLDGLIYLVASFFTWLTGNPYLGLNLILLASFPLVATMAYAAIRLVGLIGPLAVVLANAFTFIPFHFGRGIGHLPLGLMLGLTSGMILALLIGSGRISSWFLPSPGRSRLPFTLVSALLIIVTAWTGLYFAFFGLVLVTAALVWRFSAGDQWKQLKAGVYTTLALAAAIMGGLVSVLIGHTNTPAAADVALRDPMDSVAYAGNLAIALIPQPYSVVSQAYNDFIFEMFSGAPAGEPHLMANYGTWITTISIIVFLAGLVTYRRTSQLSERQQNRIQGNVAALPRASITYVAYLLIVVLLMFVPWGLNFIFSSFATAQIRAWNRLLPYILLLIILGAAAALASWKWPQRRAIAAIISGLIVAVTVVDMILPWRNLYTYVPADGQARVNAASEYASQVNAAIPEKCGILMLPFVPYPGAGPVGAMDDYDHFTIAMTNPDKSISYGAFAGSSAANEFQRISEQPISQSLWELKGLGYCGVHVDTRGYEDAQPILSELTSTLGPPVASTGAWNMFALPR